MWRSGDDSTAPSTAGAFNFWSKQQWLLWVVFFFYYFWLFCFILFCLVVFCFILVYFPLGITVFGNLFVFPNKTAEYCNNLILQHHRNNTSLFTEYQTVDGEMKRKKPSIECNLSEFRVLNLLLPEFSQLVIYIFFKRTFQPVHSFCV